MKFLSFFRGRVKECAGSGGQGDGKLAAGRGTGGLESWSVGQQTAEIKTMEIKTMELTARELVLDTDHLERTIVFLNHLSRGVQDV